MFYDAIVVLGMHMPEGKPTQELLDRVRTGAQCWIEGRAPTVIVCGGKRDDEPFPEAHFMAQLLTQQGLPPTAVRVEDQSLNTEQNLENAWAMVSGWGGKAFLLVTSDYHMARALRICRDLNIQVKGVAVPTKGGPTRAKRMLEEGLGWVEYKMGWQKREKMNGFQRLIRRIMGS